MAIEKNNPVQNIPAAVIEPSVGQNKPQKSRTFLLLGGATLLVVVAIISFLFVKPGATPVSTPELVETQPVPFFLTLDSPADGELAVNNEILVKGKTTPNTTVVLFTETDEVDIESASDGTFETTMTLGDGINTLVVTAYADSGEEKTATVTLVRDSEAS